MNKQINTEKPETTHKRIEDNPMWLVEYHRQMREAKKEWGVISVNMIADKIAQLQAPRYMKKLVIGDFGCGEAELSLNIMKLFIINVRMQMKIHTGSEGFEPSTNCSAGSHSIQAEL